MRNELKLGLDKYEHDEKILPDIVENHVVKLVNEIVEDSSSRDR